MDTHSHHPHLSQGEIQVIFGPMFSGKSTELIRRLRRYTVAKKKCLVIKYRADTRYADKEMATHDKTLLEAHPCSTLGEALSVASHYQVIGIDEAQFFGDLLPIVEQWAQEGKTVICAALDGDFMRKPFGAVLGLIPLAESVTKLSAICHFCFGPAAFSKRISSETAQEVIGGADKYVAACRKCFNCPNSNNISANINVNAAVSVPESPETKADHRPALHSIGLESPILTVGLSRGRDL